MPDAVMHSIMDYSNSVLELLRRAPKAAVVTHALGDSHTVRVHMDATHGRVVVGVFNKKDMLVVGLRSLGPT